MTVSVLNTRQDNRGKWLWGVIKEHFGPTNCLVNVHGIDRYVDVDRLRRRDKGYITDFTAEPVYVSASLPEHQLSESKKKDQS